VSVPTDSEDAAIDALVSCVLTWTGYRPDPSYGAAVRRAVRAHRRHGETMPELLARATRGDAELMATLLQAASVPETYFFRQPEHFEWIAREGPAVFAERDVIRAWSAGCATGEEAYSLAACLLGSRPVGSAVRIEVLATDLLPRNIEAARHGVYGSWSHRAAGPTLYPVVRPVGGGRARALDELREVTRFEVHNLLDPPPGKFDLILCRNVLLYFSTEAAHATTGRIREALSPEGVVLFGTLDVTGVPEGLARVGRSELNIFALPRSRTQRRSTIPPRAAMKRKSSIPPPGKGEAADVALHLSALASIERGDRRGAERDLLILRRSAPDYLPGMFEQALLHLRHGAVARAVPVMRELLRRLESLPIDHVLAGPEQLSVGYYRVAARAFLESIGEQP
jgi:chemotaxis protein methyltransferase CheR